MTENEWVDAPIDCLRVVSVACPKSKSGDKSVADRLRNMKTHKIDEKEQ